MILFQLRCSSEHEFEAWFRDGAAWEKQSAEGKVACPSCGDTHVEKAVMAPRVGRKGNAAPTPAEAAAAMRRALQQLRQEVEAKCDYVGERFAEEARKIHYGETESRGIYGETSDDEAKSLAEEGIEVARIPWVPQSDA